MNFPHKRLAEQGEDEGCDQEIAPTGIYDIFVGARTRGSIADPTNVFAALKANFGDSNTGSSSMEDRIRYFAAKKIEREQDSTGSGLFQRGYFRPDIIDALTAEDAG